MKEELKDTQAKPKGFFKSLVENIDKKMKEKASRQSCCAPKEKDKDSGKSSCCVEL